MGECASARIIRRAYRIGVQASACTVRPGSAELLFRHAK
ncbi:hypothetical protein C7S17_4405 [Burkholderia thailandensis]|nr:hypothetical protein [Burkholderia thailandensis]